MKENFSEVKQVIASLAKLKLLPVLKSQIKLQRDFIDKSRNALIQLQKASQNDLADKKAFLEDVLSVNSAIEKLIATYFVADKDTSIQTLFPDFYASLNKFIAESEDVITEFQDPERFVSQTNDKFHVKIRKPFKKFFFNLSNAPISTGNLFRKVFKKPTKKKKVWKRFVLLKQLRHYHLNNNLSLKLIEIAAKIFELRSRTAKELWNLYESLDENINNKLYPSNDDNSIVNNLNIQSKIIELQSILNQFEESLITQIDDSFSPIFVEYQLQYINAGTIENPKRNLSKGNLKKKDKQISEKSSKVFKGWTNNFTSLGDDWEMNNELYQIRYKTSVHLDQYYSLLRTGTEKNLITRSDEMAAFVKELNATLNLANNKTELLNTFKDIKNKISNTLTNKLIPEINSSIMDQNFAGIVAEFENIIREEINSVKENRVLVKTEEYDQEIKDSEINTFSPKEIIEYSTAPKFFSATGKLKTFINNQVQQIQIELAEIDHISDFNVESAFNLLETENDIEKSKTIAVEGLDRAVKKVNDIKNRFDNLPVIFDSEMFSATTEFNSDLKSLTETETIFKIKLNLAKAKALERSKQFRRKVIQNIKNTIPHLIELTKKGYSESEKSYQKLRELIGLAPVAQVIASEVSDYLAETQLATNRLPFVYQRLFEVKPLNDQRFFFGREAELNKLNRALTNWKKEKFASTIIVGEKGSGSTSLINYFLAKNAEEYEVIRSSVLEPIYDLESFFSFLSEILKVQKFRSMEDIIERLNSLPAKKIIIVENLQRLFLRKVDGFIVLKSFFEIISKTNKNIFWISTSTIYGWTYLDKTIDSFDYFGYVINLTKLDEEQITNLVSKRHRVSGYNIEYQANESIKKSKSFKKLSEEDKQPYLMKKYFEELNKFAQSNISLALIFWLRSAQEIIDDEIKIGSPPDLDYSFLSSLSNDKVFALNVLLLHDGLKEDDYSRIFDLPIDKSRLLFLLMYDDGIVVKQNNLYVINPLLYRQIVSLLKSKNIIH